MELVHFASVDARHIYGNDIGEFGACETGKGWEACSAYCHPEATFSSQTGALSDISTLEGYWELMKNLLTPIPGGHYELKFFAADDARNSVAALAVFHGTQTGPGGPVPPTGKWLLLITSTKWSLKETESNIWRKFGMTRSVSSSLVGNEAGLKITISKLWVTTANPMLSGYQADLG